MTIQHADPDTTAVAPGLAREHGPFLQLIAQERWFLLLVGLGFAAIGLIYQDAFLARWVGFALAGYSAVANDSIQTIGTFIASNRKRPWWLLWLFIGGIFLVTVTYSWMTHAGDVTYQRLASKGFEQAPTSFGYLQVAAPLVLLILTRARMPVSTTFLLLSCFATTPASVGKILTKSLLGYGVAFAGAFAAWMLVSRLLRRVEAKGEAGAAWAVGQWITSGLLWSVWIMQDAANIAVYLPRQLSLGEFIVFAGVVFLGLGLLFKVGGARVQKVVEEKSSVTDVRSATVVDLIYAVVLYIFKVQSKIPMSTTWVFVGLLAGRELAMCVRRTGDHDWRTTFKLVRKDLLSVSVGLVISVLLALAVNDAFRQGLFGAD